MKLQPDLGRQCSPVSLPWTEQWEVLSAEGKVYRIFLAWPDSAPSAETLDVLYLLDANAWFGTMVESLRMQARRPETTGVRPALVVGIGYPTDAPIETARRQQDFTPARLDEAGQAPRSKEPGEGGADRFLAFITDVLNPLVDRRFGLRSPRRMLFGHSFGGLFVLHTLFTRSEAFVAYAAASPSIWQNTPDIFDAEASFRAKIAQLSKPVRLLVTIGAQEEPAGLGETGGRAPEAHPPRYMRTNAEAMYRRLATEPQDRLQVGFRVFEDETHGSVVPAAISASLRFLLQQP